MVKPDKTLYQFHKKLFFYYFARRNFTNFIFKFFVYPENTQRGTIQYTSKLFHPQ